MKINTDSISCFCHSALTLFPKPTTLEFRYEGNQAPRLWIQTPPQTFPATLASDRLARTTPAWTQSQAQGFCLRRAQWEDAKPNAAEPNQETPTEKAELGDGP